jgi:hypothetical protein
MKRKSRPHRVRRRLAVHRKTPQLPNRPRASLMSIVRRLAARLKVCPVAAGMTAV